MIHSLNYDEYIRSISLRYNKIGEEASKESCKLLKNNQSLIKFDLRNNPGYDTSVKRKTALSLIKNIQNLKVKD